MYRCVTFRDPAAALTRERPEPLCGLHQDCRLRLPTRANEGGLVASVIIGVDPHKRSHTAVVLDTDEAIAAQLRVSADRRQTDRLLAWLTSGTTACGRLRTPTVWAGCWPNSSSATARQWSTFQRRCQHEPGDCQGTLDEKPTSTTLARLPSPLLVTVGCVAWNSKISQSCSGCLSTDSGIWSPTSRRPSAGCTRCWPNSSQGAPSWVCRSPRQPSCWGRCVR